MKWDLNVLFEFYYLQKKTTKLKYLSINDNDDGEKIEQQNATTDKIKMNRTTNNSLDANNLKTTKRRWKTRQMGVKSEYPFLFTNAHFKPFYGPWNKIHCKEQ